MYQILSYGSFISIIASLKQFVVSHQSFAEIDNEILLNIYSKKRLNITSKHLMVKKKTSYKNSISEIKKNIYFIQIYLIKLVISKMYHILTISFLYL